MCAICNVGEPKLGLGCVFTYRAVLQQVDIQLTFIKPSNCTQGAIVCSVLEYLCSPVLGKVTFKSNALQYCVTP